MLTCMDKPVLKLSDENALGALDEGWEPRS
jgi:hypothetical protein